jgi:hypothetical protein
VPLMTVIDVARNVATVWLLGLHNHLQQQQQQQKLAGQTAWARPED